MAILPYYVIMGSLLQYRRPAEERHNLQCWQSTQVSGWVSCRVQSASILLQIYLIYNYQSSRIKNPILSMFSMSGVPDYYQISHDSE